MRRPFAVDTHLRELTTGERLPQFQMRIAADGGWHYQDSPIARPALVRLFATAFHRAADGSYWLVTPFEAGRVLVDDVPFTIVELAVEQPGAGQHLRLRTNLDEWLTLDAAHPLVMRPPPGGGPPAPYVTVRPGFEARLLRAVFYHLAELAELEPASGRPGVRSAGCFFTLDEAASCG